MDFNLLRFFAEHAGETLDRSRLMEQTRGRDLGPLDRSLDVQISRLRQRLQDDGRQPDLIKTVRGQAAMCFRPTSAATAMPEMLRLRAWPDSLLGRIVLVMVIGVVSAQLVGTFFAGPPAARQRAHRGPERRALPGGQCGRLDPFFSATCRRSTGRC